MSVLIDSFSIIIIELFNFTLLTCEQPSPTILVQLLGQQDNNARRLLYRQKLRNSTTIPVGSGGIVLGTYYFTVNCNISTGSIGIAVCAIEIHMVQSGRSNVVVLITELKFGRRATAEYHR